MLVGTAGKIRRVLLLSKRGTSAITRVEVFKRRALHDPSQVVHVSVMLRVQRFAGQIVIVDFLLQLLVHFRMLEQAREEAR